MDLPTDIMRKIGELLCVREILAMEVAFHHEATPKTELIKKFHREPVHNTFSFFKRGRIVTYSMISYFIKDRLYTKVESFYGGKHPITSVVTHTACKTTSEANIWTVYVFTQQPTHRTLRELGRRHRSMPMLLQLHGR